MVKIKLQRKGVQSWLKVCTLGVIYQCFTVKMLGLYQVGITEVCLRSGTVQYSHE